MAPCLVVLMLVYSAFSFVRLRPTVLTKVRVLSSLLDFELDAQTARIEAYRSDAVDQTVVSTKPPYLGENDRVLFLDNSGNDQFWLIKQGVFWSEPYAEAYAWQWRGKDFLEDRRYFYALLDRIKIQNVEDWLDKKGVTLIVDRRDGADEYLGSINQHDQLRIEVQQPGVWRRRE
jgi:hypothetical protein